MPWFIINLICDFNRKKKEIRESNEKQWTEMEVDMKNDDIMKKNGEDKLLVNLPNNVMIDDSLPKINPVKWTVRTTICSS